MKPLKAFATDSAGRVTCDQCGGTSPRLGTVALQTHWQRTHRQFCPLKRPTSRRSTSNANVRGNTEARRRRKAWLVEHWRADVDVVLAEEDFFTAGGELIRAGEWIATYDRDTSELAVPACRCWECGDLLTAETVVADRIKPGCEGGTYARHNLRPQCKGCSERQGGRIGQERKKR